MPRYLPVLFTLIKYTPASNALLCAAVTIVPVAGEEPVFIVYLPYADDVTGRAEDKIAQVTYRLKVDIIARNGASYTDAEFKIRTLLEDRGFTYRNGEGSVDEDEPYNYHRTLYYNKNFYFNELENKNEKEIK